MLAGQQGVHADARLRRQVLEALALQLVGDEHLLLLLRQFFQRHVQFLQQRGSQIGGLRSRVRRRQQIHQVQGVVLGCRIRFGLRFPAALAVAVRDAVLRHPEQPGAYLLDGLQQPIGLEQLGEDLLQDVFHVRLIRHPPADEVPEARALAGEVVREPPALFIVGPGLRSSHLACRRSGKANIVGIRGDPGAGGDGTPCARRVYKDYLHSEGLSMRHPNLAVLAATLTLTALGAVAADTMPTYVTAALDAPGRKAEAVDDAHRQVAAIMAFAQVKPGQKVAELIPGEGYWTRVFSGIVGDQGHVYTVWPDGYQQYVGESYARWQKLVTTEYKNVSLIRGRAGDLKLPEPVDLVFTNQNYHDYHDKFMGPVDMAEFGKQVLATLKPGGVFVVIDHTAAAGSGIADTETLHRIDPEVVKQEMTAAGFVFDGSSDALH